MIEIRAHNESFVKVFCQDWGVEQEICDYFTFTVPGAKFMPAFKKGVWDGRLRLYNLKTKSIYKGLVDVVVRFAQSRNYPITVDPTLDNSVNLTLERVREFMMSLNLYGRGQPMEIREYQFEAVHKILGTKRNIALVATGGGKSLILNSVIRYHLIKGRRILLIVPTVNLVNQMIEDFHDYSSHNGWNVDENVHGIFAGQDRVTDKPVIISTWQSLASMMKSDPKHFKRITESTDVLLCDETHLMKSTVTSQVIEAFTRTEFRTGVSGTLDGTNINELTLTGLIGPIHKIVTTKQMMDRGQSAQLAIKILLLKHPEYIRRAFKGMEYMEEIKYLVTCDKRNQFISNLALACKGNTLILFNFVAHGQILYEKISKGAAEGRKVYFIHGKVEADEREHIRKIVDTEDDSIIIATSSLFSTGTNIPSLENIIFAIPTKSNIRIRQSIGRGVRLKEGKKGCKVFDISDDLRVGKGSVNTTYRHMEERVAIYTADQFNYSKLDIDLEY
jgi:superfamily II DNA or RNA helicase